MNMATPMKNKMLPSTASTSPALMAAIKNKTLPISQNTQPHNGQRLSVTAQYSWQLMLRTSGRPLSTGGVETGQSRANHSSTLH